MKTTKKSFILNILVAGIMLICISISVSASTNDNVNVNSDVDVEEAYSFATEFLTDFYNGAHYISEDCNLSKYISNENFLEYMKDVYWGEAFAFSPGRIEDHLVRFTLKSSEVMGDCVWLNVATNIEFKYIDSDSASNANNTVELIIGFENENYVLKDYFNNLCDTVVRGGITSIDNPYFWDDSAKADAVLAAKKEFVEARKKLHDEIDARSAKLSKDVNREGLKQKEISPYMIYHLDKSAMVDWAQKNYNATIVKSEILTF